MTTEQTACILCSRNCGLRVEVEGSRFTSIRGDEAHPVSKGYLCQKAARLQHYQENADRLEHPLRREPDGSFVRVGWDEALADIARRLIAIRERHGGRAFAFYGGGGQGNHLGGAYSRQLTKAMKSRFVYSALAQEKTGDFWVNGRLFGDQRCHLTEDVEHADFVLFIGTNPFQAHGIPNARDTLRELKKDPARQMVVVDPRKTETARLADVHLQLRPGTDAFLMAAILAIIVREGLHDREFLARRCTGFDALEAELRSIPVEDYVRRADVPLADVERVARGFAQARTACVRIDLGLQQSLHSTLNSYLEKLLFLVTGNFGKRGGNNFHSFFLPLLGHTDERDSRHPRTAHHKMHPISGIYPPNILPSEIEHEGEDRIRAMFVDSANPALTGANTAAYERAFSKLELLVVVDVAMTETARLAHYVLPAATQFEKWECTGFNLEFPDNAFHLRHPVFPPRAEALPEPEIYTRLLEAMGELPTSFPLLRRIATREPAATKHVVFLAAMGALLVKKPRLRPFAASIIYRALGPTLRTPRASASRVPPAAAAPLLALALQLANQEPAAVRRAGHRGNRLTLGVSLFHAILERAEGTLVTRHEFEDTWSFIRHRDGRIHLDIPEMLQALHALRDEPPADHPLVLIAGERRGYNANQIYRDPAWRKTDLDGAMRMHPDDARALGLRQGARALCTSATGELPVTIELDEMLRPGMVIIPHGYGMRYRGGEPNGPQINRLTASEHCDPLARTPYHKHVPVSVRAIQDVSESS
ncbi:Formate dehydrogenase-O, major subunit [Cystobacter fuscus DSM 2262]|uniref:Formate dehydrogenase-O, major subunit n=1 Tax=Cystobacter fuscus (strain ATCC 25194 / DSM 2262 / NBRC 100088 / M29) TaxID=1242864 RepID=S9QGU4_CYSF2|nr:molybdopterin-dependent oxidoreductase [Cystobacter fuscus]EPX55593.1 Formate dehydrogenase-O, major subunit [Cystobacter fuscus DSM 2262]